MALDRPLSLAEALDLPLVHMRQALRSLMPTALVAAYVAVVPLIPTQFLNVEVATDPTKLGVEFFVVAYGGLALTVVLNFIGWIAMTRAVRFHLEGEEVRLWACFKAGLDFRVLLTGLLAAIPLTVVAVPSFCCLMIPLVLCLPFFVFIGPAFVFEGRWGADGLGRGFALSTWRTSYFRALAVVIVITLFRYATQSLVSLPVFAVQGWLNFRSIPLGGEAMEFPVAALVIQLLTLLITPLFEAICHMYSALALSFLFLGLRNQREGQDLDNAVSRRLATLDGAGA